MHSRLHSIVLKILFCYPSWLKSVFYLVTEEKRQREKKIAGPIYPTDKRYMQLYI